MRRIVRDSETEIDDPYGECLAHVVDVGLAGYDPAPLHVVWERLGVRPTDPLPAPWGDLTWESPLEDAIRLGCLGTDGSAVWVG